MLFARIRVQKVRIFRHLLPLNPLCSSLLPYNLRPHCSLVPLNVGVTLRALFRSLLLHGYFSRSQFFSKRIWARTNVVFLFSVRCVLRPPHSFGNLEFSSRLLHLYAARLREVKAKRGFPKIRGTFLGVPIIQIIVFCGSVLGPPI